MGVDPAFKQSLDQHSEGYGRTVVALPASDASGVPIPENRSRRAMIVLDNGYSHNHRVAGLFVSTPQSPTLRLS